MIINDVSIILDTSLAWSKEASVNEDIYLSKMLRPQHTIPDIAKCAELIYHN